MPGGEMVISLSLELLTSSLINRQSTKSKTSFPSSRSLIHLGQTSRETTHLLSASLLLMTLNMKEGLTNPDGISLTPHSLMKVVTFLTSQSFRRMITLSLRPSQASLSGSTKRETSPLTTSTSKSCPTESRDTLKLTGSQLP